MQRLVDILTRPLFPAPPGLERLRTRLAVLGFWMLLGSLEATKEVVAGALEGMPRSIEQAMLVNFPWWFFWAGGTLIVLWLARRFPFDSSSGTWTRAALVHGVAAAITAALHLSFVALFIYYTLARGAPITRDTLGEQIRYWMGAYFVIDFFVYWMVLGAYHGFLYYRRFLEGQVREAEARELAATLAATAAEAKLQALRMELNPHFLFNALNSVTALVEDGRDEDATTMLDRLARLLRTTLRRGRVSAVTLYDEIDHIQRYLDIERVRFGDWLTTEIRMEEGAGNVVVPPMVLQPLVENAVVHGVSRVSGAAAIQVTAETAGDHVRLRVRDDGPGPVEPIREGTGLRNLRERLQAVYGDAASFSIRRDGESGCIAEIRVPRVEDGPSRSTDRDAEAVGSVGSPAG